MSRPSIASSVADRPLELEPGDAQLSQEPTNAGRLPTPAPELLARQTYLSVAEATVYLRFGSRMAFYHWIGRNRIPRCRRGRTLLFLRRDLDEAVQGRHRASLLKAG